MPKSKIIVERREFVVTREIQLVRTILTPLEACEIILRHVKSTELERLGFGDRSPSSATIEPLWDGETDDLDGFKVEMVFGNED